MISPDTMEKVKLFHDNLSDVEQQLQEYFQQPYDLMTEKVKITFGEKKDFPQ